MEHKEFFTGLQPGPEHDRTVEHGRDYIVIYLDPNEEQEAHGIPSNVDHVVCVVDPPTEATLHLLLWNLENIAEWTRVRAESPEQAIARAPDAHDQWAEAGNPPRVYTKEAT